MLEKLKNSFNEDLLKAGDARAILDLKVKYLGKKSVLLAELKKLGELSGDERKEQGRELNLLRAYFINSLAEKEKELASREIPEIDFSIPGKNFERGHKHPVTMVYEELFDIAKRLGFSIGQGPDIESDWYNFEALNIPKDHPARDTQDSFFIDENTVLRTHTSPCQIRYMEENKPPIRVVVYGRTYRRDSDVTHTPMFHQLEGLVVDKSTSFADLKGTLTYFVQEIFGKDRKLRFRPHHFPFTEPSAEVDVSCGICGGKGCRSCKHTGWLEILGAGMVHPNVLKNAGVDPKVYQGFAFGMGIERIAMLKYDIDDLRLFYDNDLRFLEQF